MGMSNGHASRRSVRSPKLTAFLLLWVSSAPLHAMSMAMPAGSSGNATPRTGLLEPCPHHHARHGDNRGVGSNCRVTTSCCCPGAGVVLGGCDSGVWLEPAAVVLMVFEPAAPPASFHPDGLERPPKPTSL